MRYTKYIIGILLILLAVLAIQNVSATTISDPMTTANPGLWTISGNGPSATYSAAGAYFPSSSTYTQAVSGTQAAPGNYIMTVDYVPDSFTNSYCEATMAFISNTNAIGVIHNVNFISGRVGFVWKHNGDTNVVDAPWGAGQIYTGTKYNFKTVRYANNTLEYFVKRSTDTNYYSIAKSTYYDYNPKTINIISNSLPGTWSNFYYDSNGNPATSTNTFNGYCKDVAGNPLQYINVSMWLGGSVLTSALTDATGYYTMSYTVNVGTNYTFSIRPPNQGYLNSTFYTGATTTPYTMNYTVIPIMLSLNYIDANYPARSLSGLNISVYKVGFGTVWYNNSPSTFTYPSALNNTDDLYVNTTLAGFYTQTTHVMLTSANTFQTIYLTENNSIGTYNIIHGYCNDQMGYHVPNVTMWLVNNASGQCIDTTTSDPTWGSYGLKVPLTPKPCTYSIICNYPSYGNMTAYLTDNNGNPIGYSVVWGGSINPVMGTWDSGDLQANAALSLTSSQPHATATPRTDYPPAPSGYNVIFGTVHSLYDKGTVIPNVKMYVVAENGTVLATATSGADGKYTATFSTGGISGQMLHLIPGTVTGYSNTSMDFWVVYPLYGGVTTINYDFTLTPLNQYMQFVIKGNVIDYPNNVYIASANLQITDKNSNVINTAQSNSNGFYAITIDNTVAPGTYTLTCTAAGYDTRTITFGVPDTFTNNPTWTTNLYLYPTQQTNGLGGLVIKINDTTTGQYIMGSGGIWYSNGTGFSDYAIINPNTGTYISNMTPGAYTIKANSFVYSTQYNSVTGSITIVANTICVVTLSLTPVSIPTVNPSAIISPVPSSTNPYANSSSGNNTFFSGGYWGLDQGTMNTIFAFILLLICLAIGGYFGKGFGAAIGAAGGFAISYAFHWIDTGTAVLFVIVSILIIVVVIFFPRQEGG